MKLKILTGLILTSLFLFLNCNKDKPCTTTYYHEQVRQPLRDYFPYKSGQKIKFNKYIDTAFISEIIFVADSSNYYKEYFYKGGPDRCPSVDSIEHYTLRLVNSTEVRKDCYIDVIGNYYPNKYDNDQDFSSLDLTFRNNKFTFDQFGRAIMNNQRYYEVDSVFMNGKYYGKTFRIKDYLGKYIYFNSSYGILMFINDSTKEQLIYTQ